MIDIIQFAEFAADGAVGTDSIRGVDFHTEAAMHRSSVDLITGATAKPERRRRTAAAGVPIYVV